MTMILILVVSYPRRMKAVHDGQRETTLFEECSLVDHRGHTSMLTV